MTPTPPGWFPDPEGAPALRLWDGVRWTDQYAVEDRPRTGRTPLAPLPIASAVAALSVTFVSLAASRALIDALVVYRWPLAVYVVIAALVGYGPLLGVCAVVVRRWGTGSWSRDLGFRFRPVDLGWGPLTWIACLVAQTIVAVVILALDIPIVSNTEGISKLSANRAYVISFAIVAVVAAPVIEELVFRGVVLNGFRSRWPTWLSVGAQGVLFGVAHIDPTRGMGNIGLVMILATVGVVLGGAASLVHRLAPTMISHALTNILAVVLTLTR